GRGARTAAPSRARPAAEADDDRTGRDGGHATRPKDREAP
ncbi:GntR family transcriptional regulator, partial [Streptomyces sp. WAC04770]